MSESSPRPRPFRERFESSDLEETEQFVSGAYTSVSLQRPRRRDGFRFRHDTTGVDEVMITRTRSSHVLAARARAHEEFVVGSFHARGATWTSRRRGTVHVAAGEIGLLPTGEDYHNRLEPGRVDTVVLTSVRVREHAAHLCGIAPEELDFTGLTPRSPAMAAYWGEVSAHVRDDVLAHPDVAREPLVLDLALGQLATALLAVFPNTALETATDPHRTARAGDVGEATLRDVLDYLTAHAGDPIGPAEVAATADTPYRDVADALRRRRGVHPASLLWNARLRGAHRDLHDADPATHTVTAIAARWGFTDLDAFTAAYTTSHGGETPEQTLRR